jgi:CTP:molybdopterin cytidylyltransferase MocA
MTSKTFRVTLAAVAVLAAAGATRAVAQKEVAPPAGDSCVNHSYELSSNPVTGHVYCLVLGGDCIVCQSK